MGDAAKRVNQLCEELDIPLRNPKICAVPNQQNQTHKQEKKSQYKGVTWSGERRKWKVQMWLKEGKVKYGGYFEEEVDAAKKVNQLCEELRIPLRNPEIGAISNQQSERHDCQIIPNPVIGSEILQTNNDVTKLNKRKREKEFKENDQKASEYKGVYWSKQIGKWYVLIFPKGQKPKYGGRFKDELEAAKGVNQLCEELGIPLKNPEISAIPNQQYQKKEKTSQYKGVTWHKKMNKWYAQVFLKRGQQKCGGYFKDELDAAKGVNQLCEELEIPLLNPEISMMPNQQYGKKEKTSQYKGVFWHRKRGKWCVQLKLKGQLKCGGYFEGELDAAKKVNQLCEELRISLRNPGISGV